MGPCWKHHDTPASYLISTFLANCFIWNDDNIWEPFGFSTHPTWLANLLCSHLKLQVVPGRAGAWSFNRGKVLKTKNCCFDLQSVVLTHCCFDLQSVALAHCCFDMQSVALAHCCFDMQSVALAHCCFDMQSVALTCFCFDLQSVARCLKSCKQKNIRMWKGGIGYQLYFEMPAIIFIDLCWQPIALNWQLVTLKVTWVWCWYCPARKGLGDRKGRPLHLYESGPFLELWKNHYDNICTKTSK